MRKRVYRDQKTNKIKGITEMNKGDNGDQSEAQRKIHGIINAIDTERNVEDKAWKL